MRTNRPMPVVCTTPPGCMHALLPQVAKDATQYESNMKVMLILRRKQIKSLQPFAGIRSMQPYRPDLPVFGCIRSSLSGRFRSGRLNHERQIKSLSLPLSPGSVVIGSLCAPGTAWGYASWKDFPSTIACHDRLSSPSAARAFAESFCKLFGTLLISCCSCRPLPFMFVRQNRHIRSCQSVRSLLSNQAS